MGKESECFSKCFLSTCISPFEKSLLSSICQCLIRLFSWSLGFCFFVNSSYSSSQRIIVDDLFSHSVGFLFTWLTVFFFVEKNFSFVDLTHQLLVPFPVPQGVLLEDLVPVH